MDLFDNYVHKLEKSHNDELKKLKSIMTIKKNILKKNKKKLCQRDTLCTEKEIMELQDKINKISDRGVINTKIAFVDDYKKLCVDESHQEKQKVFEEMLIKCNEMTCKVEILHEDTCPTCKMVMKNMITKSELVCTSCGFSKAHIDTISGSLNFVDSDMEFSNFSYKRINHFSEWLQNIQGKSKVTVEDHILKKIILHLRVNKGIEDKGQINFTNVRASLKDLKLSKYYDHTTKICELITGKECIKLTKKGEEKIRLMFIAIQQPFEKYKPESRKNFLSYSYCLYKFFELIGCNELLENFTLIKGVDKLKKQDEIFEKICKELKWEFIKSI